MNDPFDSERALYYLVMGAADALAISRLQCGVADTPVKGDVLTRKLRDIRMIIWTYISSRLRLQRGWNLPV